MDDQTTPPQPSEVNSEPNAVPMPGAVSTPVSSPAPDQASPPTVMPSNVPPSPTEGAVMPKPRPRRRVYVILGILVVILIALIAWRVVELRQQAKTTAAQPAIATPKATSVSPASGSDNQTLTNDLGTVNNGLNTDSQAQDSADSAINDQQQEVSVPTN